MDEPVTIRYRKLTARITHSKKDGLFHAYWSWNGQRGKRASKTFEGAKEKALTALKLIHNGQSEIASLNNRELRRFMAARDLLKDAGIDNPLQVASEYIEFRKLAPEANLAEVARFWANSHSNIHATTFEAAGRDWFDTNKARWKKRTRSEHEKRLDRLTAIFRCDACDLNFESVRFFFQSELGKKSAKTRNHFRETLRGVIAHCVTRSWLTADHRLDSLLKPEKVISAEPDIITPETFRLVLETANPELRPVIAIFGFCGVRTSEIENLSWENVFGAEGDIELNAHRTKTAQRRLVPRPPALDKWLEPYQGRTGPVWKNTFYAFEEAYRYLRKKTGIAGLHNCMRHSYASYRLAATNKVEELAAEMGNSRSIIYRNYRKLVTPAQAEQWFAVSPEQTQSNLIVAA